MIVEDELMIGLHLKVDLEAMGYGVVGPISSVEGALAALEQETIHAAVLDITLYDELSLPVAQTMSDRNLPFMFLTGSRIGRMADKFDGVTILSKPVIFNELETYVRAMLDQTSEPQTARKRA